MMLRLTTSHFFKVLLNASENLSRLALAELLDQPFNGVFGVFRVIASVLPVTKWDHVTGNCSGALRATHGYPVISSKSMPETGWAFTYSAAIFKVRETSLPILGCKLRRKIGIPATAGKAMLSSLMRIAGIPVFYSSSVLILMACIVLLASLEFLISIPEIAIVRALLDPFRIVFSILLVTQPLGFLMGISIFLGTGLDLIGISLVPTLASFICGLRIGMIAFACFSLFYFAVISIPLSLLCVEIVPVAAMIVSIVSSPTIFYFWGFALIAFAALGISTIFAYMSIAVLIPGFAVKSASWQLAITALALLDWIKFHLRISFAGFACWWCEQAAKQAFRVGSNSSLAHLSIVPQGAANG